MVHTEKCITQSDDTTVKEETLVNLQANGGSKVKTYEMVAALPAFWYGDLLLKFLLDKINL